MKTKTHLKAGRLAGNVNENLARQGAKGLKVKSKLKAGRVAYNVNENLAREPKSRRRKPRKA